MLNKIRKPSSIVTGGVKKLFAYVFFGLICFILVLFMPITSRFTGGGAVAYIGKQSISSREYSFFVQNLRAQYEDRLDKADLEESERLEDQIRKRALDQLVNMYVISQGAGAEGFFVSDKAVQEEIRSFPAFQERGRFIYSRYIEILKSQRIQPGTFEQRIRRQILIQDWRNLFFTALQSNAVEEEAMENPFKVTVRFALLSDLDALAREQLQGLLKEGDKRQEVIRFLETLKVQWKTLEKLSPSLKKVFQFDNSEALMRAVLGHLPKEGFVPRVIASRDKRYVAEILGFHQVKSEEKGENFSLLLNYEKPFRLFEGWMEAQKKQTPVRINERSFGGSNQGG